MIKVALLLALIAGSVAYIENKNSINELDIAWRNINSDKDIYEKHDKLTNELKEKDLTDESLLLMIEKEHAKILGFQNSINTNVEYLNKLEEGSSFTIVETLMY